VDWTAVTSLEEQRRGEERRGENKPINCAVALSFPNDSKKYPR